MSRDDSTDCRVRELSELGRRCLVHWFQLETWKPKEAICLICGVNPLTEIYWDEAEVEALRRHGTVFGKVETGTFLYQDWLSHQTFAKDMASDSDQESYSDELVKLIEYVEDFSESLRSVWIRYSRAVDFETDGVKAPPRKYFDWAKKNGIKIPWLEWAISQNLVSPSKAESPEPKDVGEPSRIRAVQLSELREAAVKMAIERHVRDGVPKKNITVTKISQWLRESGKFSTNEPFSTRWRTVEGIRHHLKGKHNPLSDKRYLDAKPTKSPKFNP